MRNLYRNIQKLLYIFFFLCVIFSGDSVANSWRIKVFDAAVINGDIVTLGDIAEPLGSMSPAEWSQLKSIQLFAAPDVEGKTFQISKKKLQESLYYVLGDSASYLLLPNSLVLQKRGVLYREIDLMRLVQTSLQPTMAQLNGRAELVDYRLPSYIFLSTNGQRIELEATTIAPGRLSLKFLIKEMDNSTVRTFTGTAFLNLWRNVPMPVRPYNRGEMLSPENLTYKEQNLAYVRGEVWDGKGGPWQFNRAVGINAPILLSDLSPLAMIRKGQLIDLLYQKGTISIRQRGEALEDGGPGDTINIRNTQSKKVLFGTVIDSNTVHIR